MTDEEDANKVRIASNFVAVLTNAMENTCFSRCLKKPGLRMERTEEVCLERCMDRFLETWTAVSKTVSRIQDKIHVLGSSVSDDS